MMLPPFDGQDCRPYLKGIGDEESEHQAAGISRALHIRAQKRIFGQLFSRTAKIVTFRRKIHFSLKWQSDGPW
jgi:hypothetical protein